MGGLQVQKASIDGERRIVVADLGPVRYLAMLLGADSETALRWLALVVALLLDPRRCCSCSRLRRGAEPTRTTGGDNGSS